MGLTLDTASEEVLGSLKTVVKPFIFASIRLPELKILLFPYFQYEYSIENNGASSDSRLAIFSPIVFKILPNKYYTMVFPTFYFNNALNDKGGFKLEIEGGKFVKRNTMAYITPGLGIYGDDLPQVYNWRLMAGFRHFFK